MKSLLCKGQGLVLIKKGGVTKEEEQKKVDQISFIINFQHISLDTSCIFSEYTHADSYSRH